MEGRKRMVGSQDRRKKAQKEGENEGDGRVGRKKEIG